LAFFTYEFTQSTLGYHRRLKGLNISIYSGRSEYVFILLNASPEFTESKLSRRLFRGFSVIFSAPAKLAALRHRWLHLKK